MTSPIILTKLALPILQAVLKADTKRLHTLRKNNPGSASTLNEVISAIETNNTELSNVAASGVNSLAETYEILTKNLQLQQEAFAISDAINSVATATEEMAASAAEISQSANITAERATESYSKTESGNMAISSMMGDMDTLEGAMASMFVEVQKFAGAARAGEAGRGFAVVADEVKQLASKTEKATVEIESVTNTMNSLMQKVGDSMSASKESMGTSLDSLETVAIALGDVTSVVNDVTSQVQTISTSANEQQSVSAEMASKLNEITLSVQHENEQVNDISLHAKNLNSSILQQFSHLLCFDQSQILLQTVKADHLTWKIRLAAMAIGGDIIPENELKDHTQCRLGQWYYSKGQEAFSHNEAFRKMEQPHARVHSLGKEIAELALQGQTDAACQKIVEMENHSQQLFNHIDELLNEVNSP